MRVVVCLLAVLFLAGASSAVTQERPTSDAKLRLAGLVTCDAGCCSVATRQVHLDGHGAPLNRSWRCGPADRRSAMQVGFKRRGALAKAPAVDLQVFDDSLNVVARLGEGNALDPIHRVDLRIARITVQCHPLLNSAAARIVTRKGQNE